MAAHIRLPSNLTLVCRRTHLLDQIGRFSTSSRCPGASWTVRSKTKREKVLYQAPQIIQSERKKKDVQSVVIPDKIERSPTAILEALASTVRNDVNQPRYMTIDDPALYTLTDRSKRANVAAYHGGQKAAEYMLSTYPDYFTQIWEDPLPQAWQDDQNYVYTEPCEDALLERVHRRKVSEAITMYKTIKSDGGTLSQESQEELLELLLVFNCKDPKEKSDAECYVFGPNYEQFIPFPPSTWQKGNAAEEVYNGLPEKTAKAQCNMLRGLAANFNKEEAMNFYGSMKANNVSVDLQAYNAILRLASLDIEVVDDIKIFIEAIFTDMAAKNVQPNEDTFVSALRNCRRVSRWPGSKKLALALLSEMRACGIVPGLSTYTEILHIFYYFKDTSYKPPDILEQVLDELKEREFECKRENDAQFFRAVMAMIAVHVPDSKLAMRLHDMVQYGQNRNLLANRQSEFAFYSDFFTVIVPVESIDTVMELYHKIVPYVYFPTSEIYKLIFESIDLHESYHYLPELYEGMQWTLMFTDFDMLSCFTQILARKRHEPALQRDLCAVAKMIMDTWANKLNLPGALPLNGAIIGNLMTVHLNNDDFKTAWSLFGIYRSNRRMRRADPSEESLTQLAEGAISMNDITSLKEVLNVMPILGYDVSSIVDKSVEAMSLTDAERNFLQGFTSDSSSSSDSSDSE